MNQKLLALGICQFSLGPRAAPVDRSSGFSHPVAVIRENPIFPGLDHHASAFLPVFVAFQCRGGEAGT